MIHGFKHSDAFSGMAGSLRHLVIICTVTFLSKRTIFIAQQNQFYIFLLALVLQELNFLRDNVTYMLLDC